MRIPSFLKDEKQKKKNIIDEALGEAKKNQKEVTEKLAALVGEKEALEVERLTLEVYKIIIENPNISSADLLSSDQMKALMNKTRSLIQQQVAFSFMMLPKPDEKGN